MAVYVRDNLNTQEITEIEQHNCCEDIWIMLISEEDKGLNIGVCYRPPASDSSVNTILYTNIKQACQGG